MNPFYMDGYYAGLVNDRNNPYPWWTLAGSYWWSGNNAGVRIHCAVVEAVYLNEEA